jgi:hypothetical protein
MLGGFRSYGWCRTTRQNSRTAGQAIFDNDFCRDFNVRETTPSLLPMSSATNRAYRSFRELFRAMDRKSSTTDSLLVLPKFSE